MDIREKQNLFQLLIESFCLVNRAGISLGVFVVCSFLLFVFTVAGLLWLGFPDILVQLPSFFIGSYLWVVFWRILAAKAENEGESLSNSFSASILPAVYFLIFSIILTIGLVIVAVLLAFTHSVWLMVLFGLTLFFLVFIRLVFAPLAIAVRDQGPIAALVYSWELTRGNYLTVLGQLLISGLLPHLVMLGISRGLYTAIPLYFADSFNLADLSLAWWGVLALVVFIFIFISFAMQAFFLLVFLNLDYGYNRNTFIPIPQAQLNEQETQVFGADNNVLPPGIGKPVQAEEVESLSVVQSSVKTTQDPEDLQTQQHLAEVYQQQQQTADRIEYAEEDRMPTILFDEDMARAIEANHQMWKKQEDTAKDDPEDTTPTIKMSK